MPETHKKHYSDLGLVVFRKNPRSRRLKITVKPFKEVRVTVPLGVSIQQAESFLLEKSDWLQKNRLKISKYEKQVELAKQNIITIDKEKASTYLRQRVAFLAARFGFNYNKVSFRKQRTRWGSCSSRKNINLNINLIYLPQELSDHVILHELVHTKIANHSCSFWQELGKYSPSPKIMNKKLKDFQYLIYK